MKTYKLSDAGERGWFVGGFDRAVHKTEQCEVSYMTNYKGETSPMHYHKLSTEITLIAQGRACVNGMIVSDGDIFVLEPYEQCSIEYLEDTKSVVVKTPGPLNDKYLV